MNPIGIYGVGHLAKFIIAGLRLKQNQRPIYLYGRNRDNVDWLVQQKQCIALNSINELQQLPIIFLCVRPKQIADALTQLTLTSNQIVVSFVATIPEQQLRTCINGNPKIVRVMPNTAAEYGASCNLIYNTLPEIDAILKDCGSPVHFDDEQQYEIACTMAYSYASMIHLQHTIIKQLVASGLSEKQAKETVATSFLSAVQTIKQTNEPIEKVVNAIAWPSTFSFGIKEQIHQNKGFSAWKITLKQFIKQHIQ